MAAITGNRGDGEADIILLSAKDRGIIRNLTKGYTDDYENLAIGARDGLGVAPFDFGPVADALAERGRVVSRRAYADWSDFGDDRRLLARASVIAWDALRPARTQ